MPEERWIKLIMVALVVVYLLWVGVVVGLKEP